MSLIFTLKINCSSDAFCEGDASTRASAAPELARILRAIADSLESGGSSDILRRVRDVNGNDVGAFSWSRS